MKRSEKADLWSLFAGAVAAAIVVGLMLYYMPGMHWAVYTVFGVAAMAGGSQGIKQSLVEDAILDREKD